MPAEYLFDRRLITAAFNAYLKLRSVSRLYNPEIEKKEQCKILNGLFAGNNNKLPDHLKKGEAWEHQLTILHQKAKNELEEHHHSHLFASSESKLAATTYFIISFAINHIKASENYELAPLPQDPTTRKKNMIYVYLSEDKQLVYDVINPQGTWETKVGLNNLPLPEQINQESLSKMKESIFDQAEKAGHIDLSYTRIIQKLNRTREELETNIRETDASITRLITANDKDVENKVIQLNTLKNTYRETILHLADLGDRDAISEAAKEGFFSKHLFHPKPDAEDKNKPHADTLNKNIPLYYHKNFDQIHFDWYLGEAFGPLETYHSFQNPDKVEQYCSEITGMITQMEYDQAKQQQQSLPNPSTTQKLGNGVIPVITSGVNAGYNTGKSLFTTVTSLFGYGNLPKTDTTGQTLYEPKNNSIV